jgi:aspartyl-tRNA(Asn)/glutamyl-tRNA(Gln) amidotransferase subunit A
MYKLSGYEISQKIKNQEISAEEYINLIYERITKIDKQINSFISKNFEST